VSYAAIVAASLLAAGCSREEVTHFRVAKQTPPPSAEMPAAMGSGAGAGVELPPPPRDGRPEGGDAHLAAGGELANVNRWRNQIGLGPIDEATLARARTVVKTKAGPLHVYDFTSDGEPRSRVVAGLTEAKGDTWFVKLNGDAAAVGAARADFMKLLGSLRFE
jgi:hypothetical protein